MSKTSYTFSVLQATAAVVSVAIIAWSLGFPVLQFAEAANVTTLSNTMTDSAPEAVSNHTIEFGTPSGVATGETIVLTFDPLFLGIAAIEAADIDLNIDGGEEVLVDGAAVGASWGVVTDATTITLTAGTNVATTGDAIIIEIGTNADSGVNQITNPNVVEPDSYVLSINAGTDTGETRIAIVDNVLVTATVDTVFTFTVTGTSAGQTVGGDTSGVITTATTVPFGELSADTPVSAVQALEVSTNAANGFAVTVVTDQQLTSANGADIDGFIDGAFTSTPATWELNGATVGQEETYGHWGLTSSDTTLTGGDVFAGGTLFVSASSTPVEVFQAAGPVDASTTDVLYKVEVTSLQEAAEDYTATLTYVATPVF